jgi:hypothetical protein
VNGYIDGMGGAGLTFFGRVTAKTKRFDASDADVIFRIDRSE